MCSCAGKGRFFQNGCRCHGNGQNAKKLKDTKMIIAGYSPKKSESVGQTLLQLPWKQKRGDLK
jgi:hypothetical protein